VVQRTGLFESLTFELDLRYGPMFSHVSYWRVAVCYVCDLWRMGLRATRSDLNLAMATLKLGLPAGVRRQLRLVQQQLQGLRWPYACFVCERRVERFEPLSRGHLEQLEKFGYDYRARKCEPATAKVTCARIAEPATVRFVYAESSSPGRRA
jgi:hypothetical protein